jgi:hypothetical protein
MKVSDLGTLTAKLDGLFHLFHRLRPILGVGCLNREVPQCLHAIEQSLAFLKRPEAFLILLCFGIVSLIKRSRQIVQRL